MLAQGSPARNWQIWTQVYQTQGPMAQQPFCDFTFLTKRCGNMRMCSRLLGEKAQAIKATTQGNFSSALLRALVHFTKLCLSSGAESGARGASASPCCSFLCGSEGCRCLRVDTTLAFGWSEAYATPLPGALGVRDSSGFIWCLKVPLLPTLKPDSASTYLWISLKTPLALSQYLWSQSNLGSNAASLPVLISWSFGTTSIASLSLFPSLPDGEIIIQPTETL